jgi:biotin transport system substrate-specific component
LDLSGFNPVTVTGWRDHLDLPPDFAWLAFGMKLGVDKAWLVGVAPFVVASLIKNALRAALVPEIRRVFDRRQ